MQSLADLLPFIVPLVIAITFHEAAHGIVAYWLGDDTAKRQGRVTLNPLRHVDPLGTVLIPGVLLLGQAPVLFGYAKPVPVFFPALRHGRWGRILVTLAGPGMNLLLAFTSALLLHLEAWVTPEQAPFLFQSLYVSVAVNCVLAAFNMLPILPLDGGRVLNALLPAKAAAAHARTEKFGLVLVFGLLLLPALLASINIAITPPAHYLVGIPSGFLVEHLLHLAGIGLSDS